MPASTPARVPADPPGYRATGPIVSGRYRDRFERHGRRWRFTERRVRIDLTGDVSRHLRPAQ